MKVFPYTDVKPIDANEGAEKVKVRWLITKEMGAPNFAMRLFEVGKGGCSPFHNHDRSIATAAYGTPLAPEINVLREWRDFKLRKSMGGRMFVKVYYVVSPSIALIIAKSEQLKYLTRKTLTPIVEYFKRKYRSIRIMKTHDSTCV